MNAWLRGMLVGAMAALVVAPPAAQAQAAGIATIAGSDARAARQVVIYRCTDAAGRVTIQNDVACPKGTRQQRQAIDVPPPVPAYVPREERMPASDADERAAEAAAIAAGAEAAESASAGEAADDTVPDAAVGASARPGPPPALYSCRTWDERDVLTEDATPAERCAPLRVVAADGSARSDAAACEKVKDRCEAVPAESLCSAWRHRVDEAEFRWKFAGAKQDDARRREYELLEAKLARSDCPR